MQEILEYFVHDLPIIMMECTAHALHAGAEDIEGKQTEDHIKKEWVVVQCTIFPKNRTCY